MENETLEFRVDTNQLLTEITEFGLPRTMGVLFRPINIFRNYLCKVAERATQLNDPKLNVLMLSLGLYEVSPKDVVSAIEKQKALIEKYENEQKIKDAAPDLLNACKQVMTGGYGCAPSIEYMDKLKTICETAIKKATE